MLVTKLADMGVLQDGEESAELPEDIPQGSTAVADMDKEKSKRNTHSQETSDYQPKR